MKVKITIRVQNHPNALTFRHVSPESKSACRAHTYIDAEVEKVAVGEDKKGYYYDLTLDKETIKQLYEMSL